MTIKKRDPDTGQIVEKELSSEKTREMAKARWRKVEDDKASDAASLLIEAGYKPSEAPTILAVLAEQIAARGARSVSAVREFMRLTRQDSEPINEEGCRRCARIDSMVAQVSVDKLVAIVDALRSDSGKPREWYTPD
jgi:hypothetical protein